MNWFDVFLTEAQQAFMFLEEVHGFGVETLSGSPSGAAVVYKEASRDPRSVWIGACPVRLEFGFSLSQQGNKASDDELLVLYSGVSCPDLEVGIWKAHRDPAALASEIQTLAARFLVLAHGFLEAPSDFWAELAVWRSTERKSRRAKYQREQALVAFSKSEYSRVVELLDPISAHLRPSDRKRLEISRSRLSGA